MNSANASHGRSTGPGLASWYTPGRSDGFGDRLLMFDNTDAISLELLRFRRELATTPGFEHALRDRVERLSQLRHPTFPALRAVVHLDDQDLTLVSAHTAGQRLSDLPTWKVRRGLHPAVVTWIVRELTPALAQLQSAGPGLSHGALHIDRIVAGSNGRLHIVEHALGSALRRLDLTPAIFWRRFGLLAPAGDRGLVRLDQRTDVVQLGVIALSLLLGRTVTLHEFECALPRLLDEFSALAAVNPSVFAAPLRAWLERALQLGERPYRSADEAEDQLDALPVPASHTASVTGSTFRLTATGGEQQVDDEAPVPLLAAARPLRPALTEPAPAPVTATRTMLADVAAADVPAAPPERRRWRRAYTGVMAIVLALIAVVEGAIIAGLGTQPSIVSVTAPVLTLPQPPAPTEPLEGGPDAGRLQSSSSPGGAVEAPVNTAAAAGSDAALLAGAATRQRPGGVRWSSPIPLTVIEGDRVLGSTTDGPVVLTPGTHRLELVNAALGYRAEQTVAVRAGVITPVTLSAPTGRININAQPWALVLIDNSPIGETPLANVSVPLGEHQITFRHPQLGERRETVTVRGDGTARVSTSFER